MQRRPLGRSGLSTAPLVFGGNVFGWTADEKTSHRLLDAFVDGGFNAVDTADVYSAWVPGHAGGESESVIGRWLKARGKRDDVLILTKVAMWPKQPGLSAANIEAAVEGSLKRLQTDYIDLYQSHQDDAATPIDETLEAYDRLVKAGKVRAIGASNFSAGPALADSLKVSADKGLARYETIQPKFNLYDRDQVEGALAKLTASEGWGHSILRPGRGLPDRQVPVRRRPGRPCARRDDPARLHERQGPAGARRAGRRRQGGVGDPGPGRPGLDHGPPGHHRADRQRHFGEQLDELMGAARLTLPADVIATLDAAGA
jgi:aryl-alcohol dehydrogenase-like predicted oxidoreductase